MKILIQLFAFVLLFCSTDYAQGNSGTIVSYELAKKAAVNWMSAKGYTRTVDEVRSYTNTSIPVGEQLTFYVFNFIEGGFVIVPATKLVKPVLAYNHQLASEKELLMEGASYFMDAYNDAIAIHQVQNAAMENAATEWENLLNSATISCSGQSSLYPSLLDHYQTSRWAGWSSIYDCVTPFQTQLTPNPSNAAIGGTCVPTGLSQLCRFYRHPFVGNGSGTHTMVIGNAAGQTVSADFSTQAFDYDLMPYRIQNQGPADGFGQNDPGAWDNLYATCADERNEIGYLTWNLGVAARMNWYSPGTIGNASNWANDLVDHFGYTWNPTTDYVNTSQPATFMNALRNSIMNERPVICRGLHATGGHLFLYSGFECDNYFYANMGLGGNSDGFYYIFTTNANGNYLATPYTNSQDCATNVHPVCNYPPYYQVPATIYNNGVVKNEQALIDLTVAGTNSSVIINNGAELFFIGGNTVELLPGTEVILGGILHVSIENCNGPN
jgi:hypothetical protein